jgi:hypothetical protein
MKGKSLCSYNKPLSVPKLVRNRLNLPKEPKAVTKTSSGQLLLHPLPFNKLHKFNMKKVNLNQEG